MHGIVSIISFTHSFIPSAPTEAGWMDTVFRALVVGFKDFGALEAQRLQINADVLSILTFFLYSLSPHADDLNTPTNVPVWSPKDSRLLCMHFQRKRVGSSPKQKGVKTRRCLLKGAPCAYTRQTSCHRATMIPTAQRACGPTGAASTNKTQCSLPR